MWIIRKARGTGKERQKGMMDTRWEEGREDRRAYRNSTNNNYFKFYIFLGRDFVI